MLQMYLSQVLRLAICPCGDSVSLLICLPTLSDSGCVVARRLFSDFTCRTAPTPTLIRCLLAHPDY
jgi:hypothetical protein